MVFYHLAYHLSVPVIRFGYLGVDVFFILSGFVLSYVYADKLHPRDFPSYVRFLQARIARIYPLHAVTLGALGIFVLAFPAFAMRYSLPAQRWGLGPFLASLFLVQNWAHWLPTCWNTPSWSLSAEYFGYLTFPVFLGLTQRWRGRTAPLMLALGSLAVFYGIMMAYGIHDLNVAGTPGMLRMAFEFACGCLLYRAMANGLQTLPWAADILAAGLLVCAFYARDGVFLALPAFALIVLLAAQNRGVTARCLSLAPVVLLGEISYSIYLVHWIILQILNWLFPDTLLGPHSLMIRATGVMAMTLASATITFRCVELPARKWGRTLSLVRPQAHMKPL